MDRQGRAIGDPRYSALATLLTAPSDGYPRSLDESFDFGLQRVLDGISEGCDDSRPITLARERAPVALTVMRS